MNHRELLKKYIAYVGYQEGVDFLPLEPEDTIFGDNGGIIISQEEMAELIKLSDEVNEPQPVPVLGEIEYVLGMSDLSEAEVEAGWEQFCKNHIQPDRLFKLATWLVNMAPDDLQHLAKCTYCHNAYNAYKNP